MGRKTNHKKKVQKKKIQEKKTQEKKINQTVSAVSQEDNDKNCGKQDENNGLRTAQGSTSGFFYDVLVLMVSLLHGTLFFSLADRFIRLINDFSVLELSFLVFFFSLFLRIFQTHLLAAVKYTEKWVLRPMDFVNVFLTALFEYLLMNNEQIINRRREWYYDTIFVFCLFGVIGYFMTYRRTYKSYDGAEKSVERRLQIINIVCILVVGMLNFFCYIHISPQFFTVPVVNFVSAGVLIWNISLSIRLSKNQLSGLIKCH